MEIEILGSGCPKCIELERRVKEVATKAKLKATISHIFDIDKIVDRGVFATPALTIDGVIIFEGRLPSVEELMEIIIKR